MAREYGVDNGDGTITVYGTDDAGNHWPIRTEPAATNRGGGSGTPGRTSDPYAGGGFAWQQLAAQIAQNQAALAMQAEQARAALEFQKEQLRQMLQESRKKELANLSGPRDWVRKWALERQYNMGQPVAARGMSPTDMAAVRAQLASAGWAGGTDDEAMAAFLETVQPGTQADLERKTRMGRLPGQTPAWLQNLGGFDALPRLQMGQRDYDMLPEDQRLGLEGAVEGVGESVPGWFKRLSSTWANWNAGPRAQFAY